MEHPQDNQSADRVSPQFLCASCGYNLHGIALGSRCPECGLIIAQTTQNQLSSGKAITAMVMGIVSLVTCSAYGVPGIICGVIAVVFAKKAEIAIQVGEAPATSQGMAKAGKVCGIIGITLGSLYVLVAVGFILLAIVGAAF